MTAMETELVKRLRQASEHLAEMSQQQTEHENAIAQYIATHSSHSTGTGEQPATTTDQS